MITCVNHPEKQALSLCHHCGQYYCKDCLYEGKEYYYCKEPACREQLLKEVGASELPVIINCPNCDNEIELSEKERSAGKFHCPECESLIDMTVEPPQVVNKENYVLLASSLNQGDLGLIKSILDNAGIDFYVFGENFLSVDPLIQPARIFVNQKQAKETAELLKDFEFKIFGISKNDYE
jgi:transcription elongation factor Elf1